MELQKSQSGLNKTSPDQFNWTPGGEGIKVNKSRLNLAQNNFIDFQMEQYNSIGSITVWDMIKFKAGKRIKKQSES